MLYLSGGYSNFNLLRNQNPEIVTMIAIGGGKAGDESFTEVRISFP